MAHHTSAASTLSTVLLEVLLLAALASQVPASSVQGTACPGEQPPASLLQTGSIRNRQVPTKQSTAQEVPEPASLKQEPTENEEAAANEVALSENEENESSNDQSVDNEVVMSETGANEDNEEDIINEIGNDENAENEESEENEAGNEVGNNENVENEEDVTNELGNMENEENEDDIAIADGNNENEANEELEGVSDEAALSENESLLATGSSLHSSQAPSCHVPASKDSWQCNSVLGSDENHACSWFETDPGWWLNGGSPPKLCLHEYNDFVSDWVRLHGVFHSCMDVAQLWESLPDGSSHGEFTERMTSSGGCTDSKTTKRGIYVDVGANIGTCVMNMLARPDVTQVAAFEPSPSCLFYLTSSVQQSGHGCKDLELFPHALGSTRAQHKLFKQVGNNGNTGVNATVMGEEMHGVTVTTITLDEVFMPSPPYIHLMKLDAQGYEVKILQGGEQLLASGAINAMHVEVAPWWLKAQNASAVEYLSKLYTHNYDIRRQDRTSFMSSEELTRLACDLDNNGTILDMVALRNYALSGASRKPLNCSV